MPCDMSETLISLKRYLDVDHSGLLQSTLESYRAALAATGSFGVEACPSLGREFEEQLYNLQKSLEAEATPDRVSETHKQFETELKRASTHASEHLKRTASELKDLMLTLARTSESVGERDHRYAGRFQDFSNRLHAMSKIDDLAKIRQSLVESAKELKVCVDEMARDSEQAVKQLRAEVTSYQEKLVETERLASRDKLTGLGNRRRIEFELDEMEQQGRGYCVMMMDVNGLKQVNDRFGHPAGDQVLKQFATELKAALRPADLLGRWGGDEFVAVLSCSPKEVDAVKERVRKWVFGEYTVDANGAQHKVAISAALGVAASRPKEPFAKVIERADTEMYADKSKSRK
jgi:diguanylate cyclase (GGDEF)-like protein